MDSYAFEILFNRQVPHIVEKIFFSLDYESLKKCLEVCNTNTNSALHIQFIIDCRVTKGVITY